jgi:hypothetical protein
MEQNWKIKWFAIKAIFKTILSLWWIFAIFAIIIVTTIAIISTIGSGEFNKWYDRPFADFKMGDFLIFFILYITIGKSKTIINNKK